MSWVTVVWSMDAAACLTLAAVHLVIGFRRRGRPNFYFALTAVSAAAIAGCGLWMMRATSAAAYGDAVRWAHVPIWLLVIGIVLFVRSCFTAGDPRLAWATIAARTIALAINFLHPPNLNYESISGLRTIPLWGDRVAVAEGVRSSWSLVGEFAAFLSILFLITAVRDVWRRGDRWGTVVCGSLLFVAATASMHTTLVHLGLIRWPYVISLVYLVVVAAMYAELSHDVVRAAELAEQLQQSERRTAMADEAAGIGHWTWQIGMPRVWMSHRARELHGCPPDGPLDVEKLYESVDPEDRPRLRDCVKRAIAEEGGFELEYRLVLPDGSRRWISSRGRVELDREGRPARLHGVVLDATRRVNAELEVEKQRNELVHLSRGALLGELSGSLAHELNQPLAAIMSNAEAAELMLSAKEADLEGLREILADIVEQDRVAGEVIRRLRLLLTKGEVQFQPLDLEEIVRDVIALARSELLAHGVTAATDLRPLLPPVEADRIQLQQVLLNLITNACDAMRSMDGGRRVLTVHADTGENGYVRVSVSDLGSGMAPEVLPRIFEPFFTTKPTGMGLGLAVCRTIIEAHGGRLSAENNPTGGATVSFTLRAATVAATSPA